MDCIHYFVLFIVVHPIFFPQTSVLQTCPAIITPFGGFGTIGKRQTKDFTNKMKVINSCTWRGFIFSLHRPHMQWTGIHFVCSKCNLTFMIILLRSTLARTWTRCSKNNSSKTVSFHTLFGVHFKHHFLQISDYLVFDSFQFQTHFWWNILDNLFASYFKVE